MKKLLALVLIILILLVAAGGWWRLQLSPVSSDTTTKVVVIPKGEGVSAIATRLKDEDLIRSELAFKLYARQKDLASKIQAGSFKLSPSMSLEQIANTLSSGTDDVWITLLEGWRLEEMVAELKQTFDEDVVKEFEENAKEGYMFPDTYLFPKDATGEYIADTLKNTFESRYTPELKAKIKSQGLTEEEGVILASLVEREGRSQGVRTEIAGILLKRLNMDMKLDVDATIQYILGYQADENPPAGGWWKRHISNEDKKLDSPFNTYANRGLPPAPICNPSLSSLEAVANGNPDTPYVYYYHDSEGKSHYARTLEEHGENVANNP
jgi:UPF0755 protein